MDFSEGDELTAIDGSEATIVDVTEDKVTVESERGTTEHKREELEHQIEVGVISIK